MTDQDPEKQKKLEAETAVLVRLVKTMNEASLLCDQTKEANTLAYLLIIRALDILEAWHGDDFYPILSAVIHDRQLKRRVPVTEEYSKKIDTVRKFLS